MVSNFKKSNINNSELMQNLVKIALEKGIIKNKEAASIKKEASLNLNPTEDLNSNILILKAALEERKLYKEAKELEESFVFYIKAEKNLYELNNDFTLDEMNKVHPGKESIDVAGDNVVENLEEEHNAIMKAVANLRKKKDLNKVASLIKNATEEEKAAYFNLKKQISEAFATIRQVCETRGDLNWASKTAIFNTLQPIEKLLQKPFLYVPDIDNLKNYILEFEKRIDPSITNHLNPFAGLTGVLAGGLSENALNFVKPALEKIKEALVYFSKLALNISEETDYSNLTNQFNTTVENKPNSTYTAKEIDLGKSTKESRLITTNLDNLNNYKQILNANIGKVYTAEEIKSGLEWIDEQSKDFIEIQDFLDKDIPIPPKMVATIQKLDAQVKQFYNDWIK